MSSVVLTLTHDELKKLDAAAEDSGGSRESFASQALSAALAGYTPKKKAKSAPPKGKE